ncbi:MAG: permease [Anaerolineae bacterium]|nr:permease [Anaerolineae bacterium]
MTISTVLLGIIALGLVIYAALRRDGSLRRGVVQGWRVFCRTALLLLVAFLVVGYVEALSPQELVQAWIGPDSGWRGLLMAELIGMLLPGGPYSVFPLVAVLLEAGAGLGPAVVLVTSWANQALLTVTFEVPFMGWRFAAVRWVTGLAFPLLAGILAVLLFGS